MFAKRLYTLIVGFWQDIWSKLFVDDESTNDEADTFTSLLLQVHCEWNSANDCFNEVLDLDQIDSAIYAMNAAEIKYRMLLKEARRKGYRLPATLHGLEERRGFYA